MSRSSERSEEEILRSLCSLRMTKKVGKQTYMLEGLTAKIRQC